MRTVDVPRVKGSMPLGGPGPGRDQAAVRGLRRGSNAVRISRCGGIRPPLRRRTAPRQSGHPSDRRLRKEHRSASRDRQEKPAAPRIRGRPTTPDSLSTHGLPVAIPDRCSARSIKPDVWRSARSRRRPPWLKRRCEQAGIASCSPHDLRRTFVTDMLRQRPLDHAASGQARRQTTARYDRRDEEAMRHATEKLPAFLPSEAGRGAG